MGVPKAVGAPSGGGGGGSMCMKGAPCSWTAGTAANGTSATAVKAAQVPAGHYKLHISTNAQTPQRAETQVTNTD